MYIPKKLTALLLVTVIITASLCSCGILGGEEMEEKPGESNNDITSYLAEDEWYSAVDTNLVEPADGVTTAFIKEWTENYTIYAAFPVIEGKDEVSAEIKAFVMDKIAMYEAEISAVGDEKFEEKPEFMLIYKPYVSGDASLSFKFVTYTDSGISRTVNYIDTFVYDRQSARKLNLSDICNAETDYISVISGAVKTKLLENSVLNDHYDEVLFSQGTAANDGNYSNFVIGESNIIFFFNQGRIASPLAGSFEVSLDFDEIPEVLNADLLVGKSVLAVPEVPAAAVTSEELPAYLQSAENEMAAFSLDGIDPINDKVVALTFDDGPNPTTTMQIVDTLAENGGKATFFMVGERAEQYPDTARAVYEAGMEVGNHSYGHPDFFTMSYEGMVENLEKANDHIEAATGKRTIIFRAPFGNVTSDAAEQYGRMSVYWTIDTLDWEHRDSSLVYSNTMNSVYDGAIVLMHDIHQCTADAAPDIIRDLTDQGYKLVTITQLAQILELRGQEPTWRLGRDASTARQADTGGEDGGETEETSGSEADADGGQS